VSAIRISTTSWHYRLWLWGQEDKSKQPTNLCSYFWMLVLLLVSPVALLVALIALPIAVILIALDNPWKLLIFPAMLLTGFVLAVLTGSAMLAYEKWGPKPSTEVRSTLGLIRSFVVAKKTRVCPLIEVRSPERSS